MSAVVLAPTRHMANAATEMVHPLATEYCRKLFAYWRSLRTDRVIPSRVDFEPADLLDLLTHVLILELPDPSQVIFRLLGSAHEKRISGILSGINLLDLVPDRLRAIRSRQFWAAASQPCGIQIMRRGVSSEMSGQDYELVLLPIRARHSGRPIQMIGVGCPLQGPWRTASERFLAHASDILSFIDIGAGVPDCFENA